VKILKCFSNRLKVSKRLLYTISIPREPMHEIAGYQNFSLNGRTSSSIVHALGSWCARCQ
jgi:hypothetical protein